MYGFLNGFFQKSFGHPVMMIMIIISANPRGQEEN